MLIIKQTVILVASAKIKSNFYLVLQNPQIWSWSYTFQCADVNLATVYDN